MKAKQRCARKQLSSRQFICCFFFFLFTIIPSTSACNGSSSGCPLGRYCCEDNSCKINCDSGHDGKVGVIIGIIAAVVVGNILFWVSFCCMCWCRVGKKHTFRYRLFADKNREHDVEEDDERTKMTRDGDTETLTEEIGLSVFIPQNPNANSNPSVPLGVTPTPKTHGICEDDV